MEGGDRIWRGQKKLNRGFKRDARCRGGQSIKNVVLCIDWKESPRRLTRMNGMYENRGETQTGEQRGRGLRKRLCGKNS